MQINCKVSILTPIKTLEEEISNQVLIAENVIVGQIPSSYYNFDSRTEKEAIEMIK